jgi:hypothetical protein
VRDEQSRIRDQPEDEMAKPGEKDDRGLFVFLLSCSCTHTRMGCLFLHAGRRLLRRRMEGWAGGVWNA